MNKIIRVKFLQRAALDQLNSGHPFAAGMAVSLLQDAVEAMAHEAAARVGAGAGPNTSFLGHWEAVAKAGPKRLPYKDEMGQLNVARVGFKHHGVNPDIADAERRAIEAHRFLVETAREFFDGTDFDALSEADLISSANVRTAVKAAENALSSGDATKALERCRDGLDFVESTLSVAVMVAEQNRVPSLGREVPPAALEVVNWVARRFVALEKSLTLSVLKINPGEYWFLMDSLPLRVASGDPYWPPARSLISKRTPERAQVCIRIVVDLALRAERMKAGLEKLATLAGIPEEQRRLKEFLERQNQDTSTNPNASS
jgi:hypothetical protein